MLSIEYIKQVSEDHAREALAQGIEPYRPLGIFEVNCWNLVPIPFPVMGDYKPNGFVKVDSLFVDASGLGEEREPALTKRALIEYVKNHIDDSYYYALGDIGQFQLWVNVYQREVS